MKADFKDKVIVVTGASRGIGRALAKNFAEQNATVIANYYSNETEACSLKKWGDEHGYHIDIFRADVRSEEDVKRMYRYTKKKYGGVDALINNAGICDDNRLVMMTLDQWNNVIETNLTAVFLCCKFFARSMIAKKRGKIINIASFKGQEGTVGQCNYSASKAGVIALTKTLAKELGVFNIAVNSICPGFMVTDLNRKNIDKKKIAKERSLLGIEYSESDLIAIINTLLSDNCNGVSGRVFNLDSRLQ